MKHKVMAKGKARTRRFADGDMVAPEVDTEYLKSAADKAIGDNLTTFKEAFAAARKKGNEPFTWRGKTYSTAMAGDKPKAAAKEAPKAAAKPAPKTEASTATKPKAASVSAAKAEVTKTAAKTKTMPAWYKSSPAGVLEATAKSRAKADEKPAAKPRVLQYMKPVEADKRPAWQRSSPASVAMGQQAAKKAFEAKEKKEAEDRRKRGDISLSDAAKKGYLGIAKGGKVGSASKRADGIAKRGKTRAR